MKTKFAAILAVVMLALSPLAAKAQTIAPPHRNTEFLSLDDAKLDLNYTATTRYNVKFNWNSTHNGTDLSDPLTYHYRTDYGFSTTRYSKVSFFAEGIGKQNTGLSLLDDPSYDRTRSIGLTYGYQRTNFSLNVQYTQKIMDNTLTGMSASADQGKTLKLDITSKL